MRFIRRLKRIGNMKYIRQKLCGVLLLVLAVVSVKASEGDGTAALLIVPMGLGLIFARKPVMDFYDKK